MKLTEQQLRAIVRESIVRTLQENSLNEGKLGRALGTMALGGALMMGNHQDANAQLDFKNTIPTVKRTTNTEPPYPITSFDVTSYQLKTSSPREALLVFDCGYDNDEQARNQNDTVYIRLRYGYPHHGDYVFPIGRYNNDDEFSPFLTLQSLISIIDNKSGRVSAKCPDGKTHRFWYDSVLGQDVIVVDNDWWLTREELFRMIRVFEMKDPPKQIREYYRMMDEYSR